MDYEKYQEIHELCLDLKQNINSLQGNERILAEETLTTSVEILENICIEDIEDIPVKPQRAKKEIVFLPYKAAMWDSLESIWMEARKDPNCNVKVIPVPYYTADEKGELTVYNHELTLFPKYVPVTHYKRYDIRHQHPDVIYIHYPYSGNLVTRLEYGFYAEQLKPYTDMLVYVPYYSTTGGMAESQKYLLSYHCVDYIITQAPFIHSFFDETLPEGRLVPLGSPKFDRVIRMCNNPPKPSKEWAEKMAGKKVYFLNTSIGGMMANTRLFINKLYAILKLFKHRKETMDDVCLLWRPHPLLDSTIKNTRPEFWEVYQKLKKFFIVEDFGIFDDTPDITPSIAYSDAYIGDAGTSVTSLFGIAGKPIFLIDYNMTEPMLDDDWRVFIQGGINYNGHLLWRNAHIFYADNYQTDDEAVYRYMGQVGKYALGGDYTNLAYSPLTCKWYIGPRDSLDVIELENGQPVGIYVTLENKTDKMPKFRQMMICGNFMLLLPHHYPNVVLIDMRTKVINYLPYDSNILSGIMHGGTVFGGVCGFVAKKYWNNGCKFWGDNMGFLDERIYLSSPTRNKLIEINPFKNTQYVIDISSNLTDGCNAMASDGTYIWMLPMYGRSILAYDVATGKVKEYEIPKEIVGYNFQYSMGTYEKMFTNMAFHGDRVYIAPGWCRDFLVIDKVTDEIRIWNPPVNISKKPKNSYHQSGGTMAWWGGGHYGEILPAKQRLYSAFEAQWYEIDFENYTGRKLEVNNRITKEEVGKAIGGFTDYSLGMRYACQEDMFNTLDDFLDGKICGKQFNMEAQLKAFRELAANNDGTCGQKVHKFIMGKLR